MMFVYTVFFFSTRHLQVFDSGYLYSFSFADDRAPVREKMLVAATRATFKAEFGQSYIKHEYHVTNKNDMSLEAFERWLRSKEEPAPLSEVEKEMESAYRDQKISLPSAIAAQTLKGVIFPIDQDAEAELRKLAAHQVDFVQLSVDTLNEAIKLEAKKERLPPDQLTAAIPRDKPRYSFYLFRHDYSNQHYESIIFIYSMPSSGCTIKERMLYSSCKQPFLQTVLQNCNLQPDKKMEIDSKEVLSYDVLLDYVHPPSQIRDKGFAKPPGPPQRGTRRVTKAVV
uniref:Twinfilin-1 n=1 Tax=Ascaris suum TaxID=6253 RepID=F1L4H9_ASCSU